MVLQKRKRSFSSSNKMSINIGGGFSPNQISTPSLFSPRLRKRCKDNRLSEPDAYQYAVSLFYSAQQNTPPQFQPPSPFANGSPTQQSNLPCFWRPSTERSSSPSSISSNSSSESINTPTIIAGANALLRANRRKDYDDTSLDLSDNEDAMDVDMTMDMDIDTTRGNHNHTCTSCWKQVCRNNLGVEGKCLNCAGRQQVLVGGSLS